MALEHVAKQILVNDFDGDGRPDIFAQEGDGGIGMLLLNRGDGAFDAYRQGDKKLTFAVGDFDGDGKPAFVYGVDDLPQNVPSGDLDSLSEADQSMVLPATEIRLADVNGDGIADLEVSTGDGSVRLYPGLGHGRFGDYTLPLQGLFDGTGPVHTAWVELADSLPSDASFDPDSHGYLDLVVASPSRGEVAILLNVGGLDFQLRAIIHVGLAPSAVTAADVNGDGIADLVVTCAGSNSVWILPGLGEGLFDVEHPLILATGLDPVATYVGHFAKSSTQSLVVIDQGSDGMTYYADPFDPQAMAQFISSGGVAPLLGGGRGCQRRRLQRSDRCQSGGRSDESVHGRQRRLDPEPDNRVAGSHPVAVTKGPGLNSPYQVYVLDQSSTQVQVVSFNPLSTPPATEEGAGPPALESPSTVTLRLLPVSSKSWEVVPTLLFRVTEPNNEKPTLNAARGTTPCRLPECLSPEEEAVAAQEVTARADEDPSAEESPVQRYILGVDAVPAPRLSRNLFQPLRIRWSRRTFLRTPSSKRRNQARTQTRSFLTRCRRPKTWNQRSSKPPSR